MENKSGTSLAKVTNSLRDNNTSDSAPELEACYEDELDSDLSEDEIHHASESPDEEDCDDDDDDDDAEIMEDRAARDKRNAFIPGRDKLAEEEILTPDLSAYKMLLNLNAPWPCLSCDILADGLGEDRKTYPATMYTVASTQAARGHEKENEVLIMKLSQLSRISKQESSLSDSETDESSGDDETANNDPIVETRSIPLNYSANRIRATQIPTLSQNNTQCTENISSITLTANMMESGQVLIHNISRHVSSFDAPGTIINQQDNNPIDVIQLHKSVEGFAVDWAPISLHPQGALLTGDVSGKIFATNLSQDGSKMIADSTMPFTGHDGTVEELQWSPSEKHVFASAGNDGSVRIWDIRSKTRKPVISVQASTTDVNVLSWSRQTCHLLASGHDDGSWAVWDLRQWRSNTNSAKRGQTVDKATRPVVEFAFHREQVTCLEWHPTEDSVMLVAAGDNTLTLWDLAVEFDDDEMRSSGRISDVPPQLLFVHYMPQVKEGHWHPQIPGCVFATGGKGFGIFKTANV